MTLKSRFLAACTAAALSLGTVAAITPAVAATAGQNSMMMRHQRMMHHRGKMMMHKRMMMHHKRMMHRSM